MSIPTTVMIDDDLKRRAQELVLNWHTTFKFIFNESLRRFLDESERSTKKTIPPKKK